MTQEFIKEMEALLHEQKKTILESLASQSDEMRDLVKSVESGDEADVAADAIDRTLLTSLGSQDANRLKLIQNTFERISQGKYGYCVACGKEIPEERLRALPYALMCINCASAEERRNR
ncbi:DnaK suppressor protein [Treponema sp. JC4]|uniref:TraR/DksA family transcriptional regulator n=1 Tax=unclassified Treponema TaxID=2638727 RepID=UPI00025B0AA7|nr:MULTISPECIES: TraR/DksA family transcriptional regulator [unclassified Treponema]EID84968.1 DnaK suppressor protein [Treponema sp. JC4]